MPHCSCGVSEHSGTCSAASRGGGDGGRTFCCGHVSLCKVWLAGVVLHLVAFAKPDPYAIKVFCVL